MAANFQHKHCEYAGQGSPCHQCNQPSTRYRKHSSFFETADIYKNYQRTEDWCENPDCSTQKLPASWSDYTHFDQKQRRWVTGPDSKRAKRSADPEPPRATADISALFE